MEGIFSFEPLSGRYVARSLEPVASYVEAWRAEGSEVKLLVGDSLGWGYRHYLGEVDSTLLTRVLGYLQGELIESGDTTERHYRDLSGFSGSREFKEFFNSDIEAIKRHFSTAVVCFDTTLYYNSYGSSDFESLFHTFQRGVTGADFSIFSPPRFDAALRGESFVRNITSLLYYDNDLVVVEMSGRELRDYMEESYSRRYYRVRTTSDDLLKYRVPAYLHTSLSGVPHTVNLTKAKGKTIENWHLEDDTIYSVALNSFLARDMEVIENYGDYKTLLIRWLRTSKNLFVDNSEADFQPQRILSEIERREMETIFGSSLEFY